MDQRRRPDCVYKALHRQSMPRKGVEGRGGRKRLHIIEDCIDVQVIEKKRGIYKNEQYEQKCQRRFKRKNNKTRKQKWEEKQLYGYFKRQTEVITWTWLRRRKLQKETESLLIAKQNNASSLNFLDKDFCH